MTDGQALLAAVLAEPGDDLPRLAYADWCEETDQPERAEFIRVQIKLAPMPTAYGNAGFERLKERELYLYEQNVTANGERASLGYHMMRKLFWPVPRDWFRRGFVHTVRLPLAVWLEHGPALVRAQPIERVEVSDRKPGEPGSPMTWGWYYRSGIQDSDDLTYNLWKLLPGGLIDGSWKCYASEKEAINVLSAACLAWAKANPSQEPA